jgi:transposase
MAFIRKIKSRGRVYLAEVENQRVDGKVKQKFIRYVGVEPSQNRKLFPSSNDEMNISGVKVFGSIICLDSIARRLGFYEIFGDQAPAILSLIYCHCHDYRSVVEAEKWIKRTDLCKVFGVTEINEKQLRNGLSALENSDAFTIQKSIFEKMSDICDEKKSSPVIYDVTNTYLEGEHAGLARKGKDKEGVRGRRLIQIGLGVTKKHGIPIFHQVHRGNIHDAKIFKEAILLMRQYGIQGGTIVHDRGITSKSSVLDLNSHHWKIVAGMAMHRHLKNLISKMDFSKIENYRNRIEQGESVFYVHTVPHLLGEVKGRLVILFNPLKMQAQKEDRKAKIADAKEILETKKEIDPDLKKYLTKRYSVNAHALKREERFDGISLLFVTGKFSRDEIVRLYFEKDLIEKSFQLFKGALALRPIRHWLDGKIRAHVMICYLSYCLLTTFRAGFHQV